MSRRLAFVVTDEVTAAAFLRGYLASLRDDGWDVTVVASSSTGALARLAAREGVAAAPVAMRREPAPLADLRSLWRMRATLRALAPDVVVAATPKASLLAMLAARTLGVPARVYQVWGLRLETVAWPARIPLLVLERLTARASTLVVANSASLADALVAHGIAGDVVVPGAGSSHGVDTARWSRDAVLPQPPVEVGRAGDDDALVVGFVGRVHRDKGIDVVLDAVALLAAPVRLVVVGPSEDAAVERRLAASPHVVRVPFVDDPRGIVAALDVLVLATRREGFPNVVLEAAALEVPTITTDATGARDAVVDGETGWIVPVDDPSALAVALDEARDPVLRRRLGSAARARVVAEFEQVDVWRAQRRTLAEHVGVRASRASR